MSQKSNEIVESKLPIDKSMFIVIGITVIAFCLLYYMLKELNGAKDEITKLKLINSTNILEQVQQNNDAVRSIEKKYDELVRMLYNSQQQKQEVAVQQPQQPQLSKREQYEQEFVEDGVIHI